MASHPSRGRSPSAGPVDGIRYSNSASPQPPLAPPFTAADLDSSTHNPLLGLDARVTAGAFGEPSVVHPVSQQAKWAVDPAYSAFDPQEQSQGLSHTADITNHTFLQSADIPSQVEFGPAGQGSDHVSPRALSNRNSPSNTDSSAFPSFDFGRTNYDPSAGLDPSVLEHLHATALDLLSTQQGAANAAGPLDPMATLQSHSPTPPHLLPEMAHHQSGSPSANASPNFPQANLHGSNRPRNTSESLNPSSAFLPQGYGEWSGMGAYRGHRRTPSDNYSDISSHSNQNSPYMPNIDNFDNFDDPSPMLNPTQDPTFGGNVDLKGFNLNESQNVPQQQYQDPTFGGNVDLKGFNLNETQSVPPQQQYISPGHSPHPSPRLVAQQALPPFTAENNYGLNVSMNGQFGPLPNGGMEMFPGVGQEPFPLLTHSSPGEFGAADQMSPPEISIDFAPESKNPVGNLRSADDDALSPLRTQRRNRMRAKSESHAGSRPSSPAMPGRGRSPSLNQQGSVGSDTLSPCDNNPSSRSPSPVGGRNQSLGGRTRNSSNASENREYFLDLAIPERTPSNGADNKRVQKHPATFCCHLCSKRFTRAYNLRSHLRTHTDERPFVCTVCGKAFARQHDRKRHEGLHSGEKKFVCRGILQSQQLWGCERRFARADALGRHFRSEAGQACIKPLLEEEAAERQKAWMEEQRQQEAQVTAAGLVPQPLVNQPQMDMMGNFLPAALLQQYPALAVIDWNSVPQGPPPEEDYGGRSSFDASSGGEYYEDLSENEMGGYPDASMAGTDAMGDMAVNQQMPMGQAQPRAAQGFGVFAGGNQVSDYLSDFDGR